MGKSTIEVVKKYSEAQAEVLDKSRIADSIELELGFMSFLCLKEAEAWREKEIDKAIEWLKRERGFLNDHLLQWVPQFCQEARKVGTQMAEPGFYTGVLNLTEGFIKLDWDLVRSILDSASTL